MSNETQSLDDWLRQSPDDDPKPNNTPPDKEEPQKPESPQRIDPEIIRAMAEKEINRVDDKLKHVPEPQAPDTPPMDADIFKNLPPLLRVACDTLGNGEERETFLIGALGVLSGMLPNVRTEYFGMWLDANLYCFVIGRYGTGKGALMWAKELGAETDAWRRQQAATAVSEYNEAEAAYNRQMSLYNKGKLPEAPQRPKLPRHLKFYLPANSTKTALMQLLMENNGRGVIFETEGDTLADMLRQDYGNFSDVLRKAFHHEPVSYYRRANNEDVTIDRPYLSVVLSGTHDQLRRLVPTIENGLFSRFCFYILHGNPTFKNPFDSNTRGHEDYFKALSLSLLQLYKRLDARSTPVIFSLTAAQEQKFVTSFGEQKMELHRQVSPDLDGTSNRMAVIAMRIAMILTMIRFKDNDHDTMTCMDTDFDNAMEIARHLMGYSLYVYELLELGDTHQPTEAIPDKKQQREECCRHYDLGLSMRAIAGIVFGDEGKSSTIFRWVHKFCKKRA